MAGRRLSQTATSPSIAQAFDTAYFHIRSFKAWFAREMILTPGRVQEIDQPSQEAGRDNESYATPAEDRRDRKSVVESSTRYVSVRAEPSVLCSEISQEWQHCGGDCRQRSKRRISGFLLDEGFCADVDLGNDRSLAERSREHLSSKSSGEAPDAVCC